jgi:opacity protein-like surface antigen
MQKLTGFEKAALATTGMVSAVAVMAGSAAAQDFDGFYMGVGINQLSGQLPWGPTYVTGPYELEGKATPSMFLGYNKAIGGGSMVLGAEISFQGFTPGDEFDNASGEGYGIDTLVDMKAKVGSTVSIGANPVLLYGFAGLTQLTTSNYYGEGYSAPGYNLGIGAEVKVGSNFGVGLEYISRSIDAYDGDDGRAHTSHDQISLRAAMHF